MPPTVAHGGPLAGGLVVPWLDHPVRPGAWVAALVELSTAAGGHGRRTACRARADEDGRRPPPGVDWPDGDQHVDRLDHRACRSPPGAW